MKSKYRCDMPESVKRYMKRCDDKDEYYRNVVAKRFINYDDYLEEYISDVEDTIEYSLDRKSEIIALKKALKNLSDSERQIINECFFFEGKKPTYTDLAKKYGISRQAYTAKLDRLLKRLKTIVEYYLEIDG